MASGSRSRRAVEPEGENRSVQPAGPPHTEREKKRIVGRVSGDVSTRDVTTPNGRRTVGEFRVMQDTEQGQVGWTVAAWGERAEQAWEKLEHGDEVKIMGHWEPDYEGARSRKSYQITATESIGVAVGDDFVGLASFDRSMLKALQTTPDLTLVQGTEADQSFGVA